MPTLNPHATAIRLLTHLAERLRIRAVERYEHSMWCFERGELKHAHKARRDMLRLRTKRREVLATIKHLEQ